MSVHLTFDDGYANFAEYAWPAVQEFGFSATVFPVAGYVGRGSRWDTTIPRARHLDWRQLRTLVAEGAAVGAHTMTHPFLTRLSGKRAFEEISASKKTLEDGIGAAVTAFAYPYGNVSPDVAGLVEEAGFGVAFTMNPFASFTRENRFALPRVAVYSIDGRCRLAAKLGARGRAARTRACRFNLLINRCAYANRLISFRNR